MSRLLSYEKLLAHHPGAERKGSVLGVPAAFETGRRRVSELRAARAARSFSASTASTERGWQPVRLEFGESVRKAMAAASHFDVLVVNPVYDG